MFYTKFIYRTIIRTQGGTLTIDAEHDTVNHYGEGLVLNITAIASSSYHEFGHFHKATIKQGRMVVEETGNISMIIIQAASVSDVSIDLTKISTDATPVIYVENETVISALGSIA